MENTSSSIKSLYELIIVSKSFCADSVCVVKKESKLEFDWSYLF